MQKGIIRRLNKELPKELYDMETYFISQAENNTDFYLNKYKELSASFNGITYVQIYLKKHLTNILKV